MQPLDNVEGIGTFVEIEQPVGDDQAAAQASIDRLISDLGLSWVECIRASYLDLVLGRMGEQAT